MAQPPSAVLGAAAAEAGAEELPLPGQVQTDPAEQIPAAGSLMTVAHTIRSNLQAHVPSVRAPAVPSAVERRWRRLDGVLKERSHDARVWAEGGLEVGPKLAVLLRRPACDDEAPLPHDESIVSLGAAKVLPNSPQAGGATAAPRPAWAPPCPAGAVIEAETDVEAFGRPHRLVVLKPRFQDDDPAYQLQTLVSQVDELTRQLRPSPGPWYWALHDYQEVAALLTGLVDAKHAVQAPWWRRALWVLRVLPPPGGSKLEGHLSRRYGCAVGYVFAWSNLYIRGLWGLVLPLLSLYIISLLVDASGCSGVCPFWIVMQVWTVVWAQCLAQGGYRRHMVTKVGGCEAVKPSLARGALQERFKEFRKMTSLLTLGEHRTGHGLAVGGAGREERTAPSPSPAAVVPEPAADSAIHEISESDREDAAAVRIQKHVRGATTRSQAKVKLKKAIILARYQGAQAVRREERRNPYYKPPPESWTEVQKKRSRAWRRVWTTVVCVTVVGLFVTIALAVLLSFTQLNIYLTYVWGQCMVLDCRDPQHVHGFVGWLAEVGSDVSLAILFDVLLGELCKALADFLVGLRNHELLYTVRYETAMLSLLIEALSKVGMFVMVAFVVMPAWHSSPEPGQSAADYCWDMPDFRLCRALQGCDAADLDCCTDSLLCLSQRLPQDKRRLLFARSVRGPFMVAPFVRIIPTVIVPWVAEQLVALKECCMPSGGGKPPAARRACCGCLGSLLRLLHLIFTLDGGSVGCLRYVARGSPFRLPEEAPRVAQGALEQVFRKEFEPLDELVELKMSFIFVVMFAPLLPLGIATTLAARLLEVRTKLSKLFLVRRRSLPEDARLVHNTQGVFVMLAAQVAIFWHMGLNLVAYNEELSKHPALSVAIWLVSAGALALLWGGAQALLVRHGGRLQKSTLGRLLGFLFPT